MQYVEDVLSELAHVGDFVRARAVFWDYVELATAAVIGAENVLPFLLGCYGHSEDMTAELGQGCQEHAPENQGHQE